MYMCRVISCVVGRGCLLWPVPSLGKTLLAFALLHFVLQGQISLLLQVFLDFLLLHSRGLQIRDLDIILDIFPAIPSHPSLCLGFCLLSISGVCFRTPGGFSHSLALWISFPGQGHGPRALSLVPMTYQLPTYWLRPLRLQVADQLPVFTSSATQDGRRQWHPTPVLLPGKSHGWRSLVGCSPWGP